MKIHKCIQNTPEWDALRLGIPTASAFSNILTPSKKRSRSRDPYMHKLLAERLLGHSLDEFKSWYMERGSALEKEAHASFRFQTDLEAVNVGFVTNDSETIGASPDSFVGDKATLEIKCPSPPEHVGHLLNHGATYKEHVLQVQGQLWVCEREEAWIMSYNPEMPMALEKMPRDEELIDALAREVTAFSQELETLYSELVQKGWAKPLDKAPPSIVDILRDSLAALNQA